MSAILEWRHMMADELELPPYGTGPLIQDILVCVSRMTGDTLTPRKLKFLRVAHKALGAFLDEVDAGVIVCTEPFESPQENQ